MKEKKGTQVEGCKPDGEDDEDEVDPDMPPLEGGYDEDEKKNMEEREDPLSDNEDENEDEVQVLLQNMEVEDDNLKNEMEGVEQTVEEAGTVTAG